jgi:hypothetical protein
MYQLHKKILVIMLIFLAACTERSFGPEAPDDTVVTGTPISGIISGRLSLAQSPYLVTESIEVAAETFLFIDAGVELRFRDSSAFIINGDLEVNGVKGGTVRMRPANLRWRGIRTGQSSSQVVFRHTIIEGVDLDPYQASANGAVHLEGGSAEFTNCIFRNNYSTAGALFVSENRLLLQNTIFRENRALTYGGALLALDSELEIVNCTFYNNSSMNVGGCILLSYPGTTLVENSIFYANEGQTGNAQITILNPGVSVETRYNFEDPGSLIPGFVSHDDLHLVPGSVCRNAGNPAVSYNDSDGSRNDIGAYGGPGGNW